MIQPTAKHEKYFPDRSFRTYSFFHVWNRRCIDDLLRLQIMFETVKIYIVMQQY